MRSWLNCETTYNSICEKPNVKHAIFKFKFAQAAKCVDLLEFRSVSYCALKTLIESKKCAVSSKDQISSECNHTKVRIGVENISFHFFV